MPINETSARTSNLSAQQIRDAERAIFGIPGAANEPNTADLTFEEIEKMRQLVYAHDRQHHKIETIDINNPPQERYKYQEFPRMLYLNGEADQFIIVQNQVQLEVAAMRGYTAELKQPDPPESAADFLDDPVLNVPASFPRDPDDDLQLPAGVAVERPVKKHR